MTDVARLIDEAIAAGKLTKVPVGVSAITTKKDADKRVKLHPVFCGSHFTIKGHKPTLSTMDGDYS